MKKTTSKSVFFFSQPPSAPWSISSPRERKRRKQQGRRTTLAVGEEVRGRKRKTPDCRTNPSCGFQRPYIPETKAERRRKWETRFERDPSTSRGPAAPSLSVRQSPPPDSGSELLSKDAPPDSVSGFPASWSLTPEPSSVSVRPRPPMVPGRGCCALALAVLLLIADIRLGGCMSLTSSVSQDGPRLSFICTVRHKEREAEGLVVFLCQNRTRDCSPETSLEQLRLKRYRGPDGGSERSSRLVFTIDRATPADSGVYQCCARSRRPDVHLQGRFWSLSVTETGNYTLTGPRETGRRGPGHSRGALSSRGAGCRQARLWAMLVASLAALRAL